MNQQPNDETDIIRSEDLKEALSTQDLPTAIKTIKNYLEQQDRIELNIAVTGEAGSGKSKFVNAFRGLGDKDVGSAEVGLVETTMKPEVYTHPKYKNVKLWDLPGIGTSNYKADEYLEKVQFTRYDFFIIIASERFKTCHTKLATEIMRMKKLFYFVRSLIDVDIKNKQDEDDFDLEEMLKIIRNNCETELKKVNIEAPVFLISCRELSKYDFNLLLKRTEEDLPKHKKRVLTLAIPNITLEINERKKKALEENISRVAFISAVVAIVPLPGLLFGVDLAIVKNEIEKYYSAFGLDDPSMQKLCKKSAKTIEDLKKVMKSQMYLGLSPVALFSLLGAASFFASESAVKFVYSLILGSVVAGGMSYVTVSRMLKKALDKLAEDARNVLISALHT